MKCPYCDNMIGEPLHWNHLVDGIRVMMLYCPFCSKVLGVVNVSAEFQSRTNAS